MQKTYDRMTRTPDTSGLFCWQGESGYNLYQLFLERSIRWLKPQGRVGMVIPSGFSTDSGAAPLREALFQEMALEWLVSLTNRSKFFEIDSRFGFLALVGRKPGPTLMFRTASEQRDLRCFSRPESETPQVSKDILPRRSARNLLLPEFASSAEFVLLRRLLESHLPMDDRSQNGFGVTYRRELDMTSGTGKFLPAWQMQRQGFVADADGVWRSPDGHLALPLVQGASFHAFSPWAKEWHGAQQGAWKPLDNPVRPASPKLLVPLGPGETPALTRHKLVLRRLARNSDERTLLACVVPGYPCGDKAPSLTTAGSQEMLALCGLLNSLVLDWVCRSLGSGTNVDWHRVKALPLPDRSTPGLLDDLPPLVLALHPPHRLFEPLWRDLARHHAWLLEKAPLDWTVTHPESRRRLQAALDAKVAQLYGVSPLEFQSMLSGCELSCTQLATPAVVRTLPSRGFWRVDRQLPAEERRTNLAARWLQEPMLGYWSAKEILERCSMDYCWGAGADGAGAVAGAVSSSRHST